jgi:hypothetical protein
MRYARSCSSQLAAGKRDHGLDRIAARSSQSGGARGLGTYVDLLEELPLLVFVNDETLDRVIEIGQLHEGPEILRVDLASLVGSERHRQLASVVADSTVVTDPDASALSLVELVVGLRMARGTVEVGDVPQRLYNLLGRHHALDYPSFSRLHLSDCFAWQGVGIKSIRDLLAEAIEVGLEAALVTGGSAVRSVSETPAVSRMQEAEGTRCIEDTTTRLGGTELCVGYRPSEAEIAVASSSLMSGLPPRYPEIARRRLFALHKKATLETLGQEMGVTRERIRQLERKVEERIQRDLAHVGYAALRIEASCLRAQLGAAFRIDQLRTEWPHRFEPREPSDSTFCPGLVLLWLAGPYSLRGSWLVREGSGECLEHQTEMLIEEHMIDRTADVHAILEALGDLDIRESMSWLWLDEQRGYRVIDETVVEWGASMSSKAVAVLGCRKEPLTTEEIASLVGESVNTRSLRNQLMSDPRIKRVGKLHFGLRDWEHDEYTTVSDEIAEEIERQGGEATIAHLVEVISRTYGVSEASIRAYASTRRFVRVRKGCVRVASPDEISADTRPIQLTKGCYRLNGAWAVRARVTGETLRGSGTSVSESFIQLFGIRPGEAKELASPYGSVNVSWGYMYSYVGSLRAAVEALGAAEGDLVFIIAASPDRLEFDLVRESLIGDLSTPSQIAAFVAWGGLGPEEVPLTSVSRAIGFDDSNGADPLSVATRIRARREPELLPVIERESDQSVGPSALREILGILGCEASADGQRA